jgi:hypothetical protein
MHVVGDPNGNRTRATAVKGRCPRPLDDRVVKELRNIRLPMALSRGKFYFTNFFIASLDSPQKRLVARRFLVYNLHKNWPNQVLCFVES